MQKYIAEDVGNFLNSQPLMSLMPATGGENTLVGSYILNAFMKGHSQVEETFKLRILIPKDFPIVLPSVYELENKIPRDGNYHVNGDGSLCLGNPFRLYLEIKNDPSIQTLKSYALFHICIK